MTLPPAAWVGTPVTHWPCGQTQRYCQNTTRASTNYIQTMRYSNFPTGADGFGSLAICVLFNPSGEFPKMRKATISVVVYVCPSVHMEQLGSHWTDFHEI